MFRVVRSLLIVFLVVVATAAQADDLQDLVRRLQTGEDFRVRVQAALELGKTKDTRGRRPLEDALDDENAAVRAASAAALKVLGDPKAIAALEKHKKDSSSAVRSQIQTAIEALERIQARETAKDVEVLVEIGKMRDGVNNGSGNRSVEWQLEQTSRSKIADLPGVQVMEDGDEAAKASKSRRLPHVKLTGRLSKLEQSKDSDTVAYLAQVDYVVYKMPESAIAGTFNGSARASTSKRDLKSRKKMARLEREAVVAAIETALRRAPDVIRAAANGSR